MNGPLAMFSLMVSVGAVAVAFAALLRSRSLAEELSKTRKLLRELDHDLGKLERRVISAQSNVGEVGKPLPSPTLETESKVDTKPEISTSPDHSVAAIPPPLPRKPRVRKIEEATPAPSIDWEKFIGRRVLGWVAVGLILLAASFFIKYAFDTILGPTARVATGAFIGMGLCILGGRSGSRGNRLACSMLGSAGLLILYLAVYASFGYYTLIPASTGGAFLAAIMAEGVLLSLIYRAKPLAYLALAGALLVPVVVSAKVDAYVSFFTYLAVVNLFAAIVSRTFAYPFLQLLSYIGSQLLFWLWFEGHYHPEKLQAVVLFQSGLYIVWMLAGRFTRIKQLEAERVVMWLATALFYFIVLNRIVDEEAFSWRGVLCLSFAAVYACFSRMALGSKDFARLATHTSLSFAFLGIAIPMQIDIHWTAICWSAIGATLWWFGLRIRSVFMRVVATVFLGVSLIGIFGAWIDYDSSKVNYPLFNQRSLPLFGVALSMLIVAISTRRLKAHLPTMHSVVRNLSALMAVFLSWVMLTWETLNIGEQFLSLGEMEKQTALSVVWAIYAALLLAVGFWVRRPMVRWTGLGLLVLTVLKLIAYDLSELPAILRALTFLAAAVVSALGAWGYQRFARLGNVEKEADND